MTEEERYGTAGTTAFVTEGDKAGIPDDSVDDNGVAFDADNAENVLNGTIVEDGSLVLKLYYTRKSFNVTYQYGETAIAGASVLPASTVRK